MGRALGRSGRSLLLLQEAYDCVNNPKTIWAAVVIGSVAMICVTILIAMHVDATAVLGVISAVALPVIAAILYGKVETIQSNVNGNASRMASLVESLVEHLKTHNTVPMPNNDPSQNDTSTMTVTQVVPKP